MKLLIYLSLIYSVTGANMLAISLGAFKLSVFRFVFFVMTVGMVLDVMRQIRRRSWSVFLKDTYSILKKRESFYSLLFLTF